MMKIVIINTHCANLASISYALQRLGYHAEISCDANKITAADKLILPGVGSAAAAMEQLKSQALIELIKRCSQPVLGICLGMQLLAKHSEENGGVATLDILATQVKKLATNTLPLPHMGWNQVYLPTEHPLFLGIPDKAYFYFVHSYAMPIGTSTIAQTDYGTTFSAAVQQGNFYGVQFHPERSGTHGAQLLKNFLAM